MKLEKDILNASVDEKKNDCIRLKIFSIKFEVYTTLSIPNKRGTFLWYLEPIF